MDDDTVKLTFDEERAVVRPTRPRRLPRLASFSALDSFAECPGRWLADKVVPKPREWGSPLVVGGIVHAALELAVTGGDAGRPLRRPDWYELCLRGIGVERDRVAVRGWGDDAAPRVAMPDGRIATDTDWAKAAAEHVRGFSWDTVADGRPFATAETEQHLETEVWGIPVQGSIDYRTADGLMIDWKTGRVPRDASRHGDQLILYRAMLFKATGIKSTGMRDVYVTQNKAVPVDGGPQRKAATRSRLTGAWRDMRLVMDEPGTQEYPLRPSALCGWCPVAKACPLASLPFSKAREAAKDSLGPDDPRIRVERIEHEDGFVPVVPDDGFRPTGNNDENNKKGETETMNDDDMMALMMGKAATPKDGKPKTPESTATAKTAMDPWASPAGREALKRWNVDEPQDTKPAVDEPQETKPAVDEPVPAAPALRFSQGRPFDPSLSKGFVNLAGYGMGALLHEAAYASVMADGRDGDVRHVLLQLLAAAHSVQRTALPAATPDVPGLSEGAPATEALMAWLDTPSCRDAQRALHLVMDADPLLKPGQSDTAQLLAERISHDARQAGRALAAAACLL